MWRASQTANPDRSFNYTAGGRPVFGRVDLSASVGVEEEERRRARAEHANRTDATMQGAKEADEIDFRSRQRAMEVSTASSSYPLVLDARPFGHGPELSPPPPLIRTPSRNWLLLFFQATTAH